MDGWTDRLMDGWADGWVDEMYFSVQFESGSR